MAAMQHFGWQQTSNFIGEEEDEDEEEEKRKEERI